MLVKKSEVSRSALRYFGGKWAIAPWVMAHQPPCRIYVEPFGGAASVLLRRPVSPVEVYNDLDEEIVGIFRVLQDPNLCAALIRRLRRTPMPALSLSAPLSPPMIRSSEPNAPSCEPISHSTTKLCLNPKRPPLLMHGTETAIQKHGSGPPTPAV